ncbi:MAG TPA: methylated-DNA--[protein]-cysteine S-methyltransferase [Solirubrobacteraceae bacterium]|nr:methylated-DNA--[protein]-cysteine S-methyltransferase [Solirubrobacteraceae bacterium]
MTFDPEQALRSVAAPDSPPDMGTAADAAGLLDVAYATDDFPVGRLLLAATPGGLVRLAYLQEPAHQDAILEALAQQVSPRILASPRRLDEPRRELEEYFAGRRRRFEVALDWRLVRGFGRRVLEATARIPFGAVSTYRQVAGEAGSPRAARAAGNALGANPLPIIVPCHRVLHSTGGLGGYTGGLERKRLLLALEGREDPGRP